MQSAQRFAVSHGQRRSLAFLYTQLVCVFGLVLSSPAARAQDDCEPQWAERTFCEYAVSGPVYAAVAWDDGTGEALYVGGDFTIAGCEVVNHIARWDGESWTALAGPGGVGVNSQVRSLAVFDDGSGPALYVGGYFTDAGGVTVNHIARWDGSSWSALTGPGGVGTSTGSSSVVSALIVFDDGSGPALYAGGSFNLAGGVTVNNIAKWDGDAWSAMIGPSDVGVGSAVHAMTVFDDGSGPAIYAGGGFNVAGGVPTNRIARWDGNAWSALVPHPGGLIGSTVVYALAVFDDGSGPALYVGGTFTFAGTTTVNRIVKWNGASWSALVGPSGVGVDNSVREMTVFDDGSGPALYIAGYFTTAGGVTVNHIARWDDSGWSALAGTSGVGVNAFVEALAVFDDGSGPALYAGGGFGAAGGVITNPVAKWNGNAWSALAGPSNQGLGGSTFAMTVFDDGTGPALYAGGSMRDAGGESADHTAEWNGSTWSALEGPSGGGLDNTAIALAVFDDGSGPALYAGGAFTRAGGLTVNHIAKWDGENWSPLVAPGGVGVNWHVHALAVFDDGSGPALYAGGAFTTAGGETVNRIAKWNGSTWSALSGPSGVGVSTSGVVNALTVFDDGSGPALYAGGSFAAAGGVMVNRIAKWNGSTWSALAGPAGVGVSTMTSTVNVDALTVFDDGSGPALYAGGDFTQAGGVNVSRIAKWNGNVWSALAGPSGVGVSGGEVNALTVFNDGSGPALYAGGTFSSAGGVVVNRIAKWNGAAWSALSGPSGVGITGAASSRVSALITHDDGSGPALYAAGYFTSAGGVISKNIAKWQGCTPPPACPPDVNADTGLDILDILDFLDSFSTCEALPTPCAGASGVSADYNGDTLVDILDFLDFMDAFSTGC
jgi:hypothetical protein